MDLVRKLEKILSLIFRSLSGFLDVSGVFLAHFFSLFKNFLKKFKGGGGVGGDFDGIRAFFNLEKLLFEYLVQSSP